MSGIYLRTILYLWLAVEFLALAQLYYVGYKNHKSSIVIKSLQRLLFFTGVLFGALTIMPIVSLLDGNLASSIRNLFIFFCFPVVYYIREFRKWSLSGKNMPLPKKKK